MARGAKGSYNNGDNPNSSSKGKLPIITLKRSRPSLDSAAVAMTPHGDTIWRNTGSRARGGVFWHPRDANGKPKDRRYLTAAEKAQLGE